jgi:group I intron endonuclease
MSGVYAIVHKRSGRRYIGSAQRNFQERWNRHRRDIRKGVHTSPWLQRDYVKYGAEAFDFRILIFCEPFECVRYEQFFLDVWSCKRKLYNENRCASWLYSDRHGRGYLTPQEVRREMDRNRVFNELFMAMRSEGIPWDEASRIARELYPPIYHDQP